MIFDGFAPVVTEGKHRGTVTPRALAQTRPLQPPCQ